MDGIEVQGDGRQAVQHGKQTRRLWTTEQKRQIMVRTLGALLLPTNTLGFIQTAVRKMGG